MTTNNFHEYDNGFISGDICEFVASVDVDIDGHLELPPGATVTVIDPPCGEFPHHAVQVRAIEGFGPVDSRSLRLKRRSAVR